MVRRPETVQIVFRLNKALNEKLEAEQARLGRTKTEVLTRILEAHYGNQESKPAKKPS